MIKHSTPAYRSNITVIAALLNALMVLLAAVETRAQSNSSPYEFHHIKEQEGLSHNIINCFLKDRDGFLWIGTYDGLNRFDGAHFTVFKSNRNKANSLLHNTVHAICEDKEGSIWCATDLGLSRYNKHTAAFENIEIKDKGVSSGSVSVISDSDGNVWFTCKKGLANYNITEKKIVYYPHDPANKKTITSNYLNKNGMVLDPSGKGLWLATGDGLNYFDMISKEAFHYQNNPQRNPVFNDHTIYPVSINHHNQLIYADNTEKRIIVYNTSGKTVADTIVPVSRYQRNYFPVATIFADNDDNLWISTWNYTLQYLDMKTKKTTEVFHNDAEPTSIASEFFWTVLQDNNGALWFGTVNGISIYNPSHAFYRVHRFDNLYPTFTDTRGLASVTEDEDGSWWVGTYKKGLLHYYPQSDSLLIYKIDPPKIKPAHGMDPNIALAILKIKNTIWLSSSDGIELFDIEKKSFSKLTLPVTDNPNSNIVMRMLQQNDSLVWIGTLNGIFRYNLSDKQWRHYNSNNDSAATKKNLILTDIKQDRNKILWISIYPRGISWYSPAEDKFIPEPYTAKDSLLTNVSLNTIAFDNKNNLWATSKGIGLGKFDHTTKQFSLWRESDGLVFDHCMAALPDRQGQIWVAAYNKFSVFNVEKNSFSNFTLPFNESNYDYVNYMFQLKNGHILASIRNIMVEFMPEKMSQTAVAGGQPLINSIVLANRTQILNAADSIIHLEVDENYFSIYYSMLSAAEPGPLKYMYQLAGLDKKWVDAGEKAAASYTNLPGGNYVFRIKALSGNKETVTREIKIHIKTIFYKTWWFLLLVLLGLAAIAYWFYRYRIGQSRKMDLLHLKATRLEKDKTEIQYQNLMNQFNPHFLFNSLTSLNSLIYEDKELASQFLEHMSKVYRYLLTNKESQLVTLDKEVDFVKSYVALLKTRFENGLIVDIDIPKHLLQKKIVPVTFQIMIENAIKHNIIDDESPLHIRFSADEKYLVIVNNMQEKAFVETSNKRGLASLQTLYKFLSSSPLIVEAKGGAFFIKIPLI